MKVDGLWFGGRNFVIGKGILADNVNVREGLWRSTSYAVLVLGF